MSSSQLPQTPMPLHPEGAAQAPTDSTVQQSYGEIVKSSALIGGSSVINIALGIIRTKTMALLLGPSGFGLFGLYNSIVNLAQAVAGMGVNSSGVRQIAEAANSSDAQRLARTAAVLRRTSVALGVLGGGLLIVLSKQVSLLTFGSDQYRVPVCLLSLAVLFQLVSGGQAALIQGMRRISSLASMGALGAILGTALSIVVVYFFRDRGIAPALVSVAAMTIIMSWWYSRKLRTAPPVLSPSHYRAEVATLLKLGIALMSGGMVMMAVAYVVRIIVLRKLGLAAAGFYQSAWSLGGLYVSFILQAMAADFYPRLTAHADDNAACNRLVNEQIRVGSLLACPGAIATLTFAPVVISLLYSAKFGAAVGVLRWICLGATLQILTWPMGFIILVKARPALLVLSELAWGVVHVGLAWLCVRAFGLNGAGIAFFGAYVFHALLTYPLAVHLSGFRWSLVNMQASSLFLGVIAVVFTAFYVLPPIWTTALGVVAVVAAGTYSLRVLSRLMPVDEIPPRMRRLVMAVGLVPASSQTAD